MNAAIIAEIHKWNLPSEIANKIISDENFAEYLIAERAKYPFPAYYIPNEIEIRFDNIIYQKISRGEVTFAKDCNPNFNPIFIEWRFDDECAVFQTNDELVIDRTINLVALEKIRLFLFLLNE